MKLLRKIAPFAVSALMLASMAAAADLSTWKNTFTSSSAVVVVGSGAVGTYDMTAALTVAKAINIDTTGSSTASGSVTEEIDLGADISDEFGTTLDDSDLDAFQDTSVEIDDTDISTHDELALGADSPSIETSATSSERYGADPKMEFSTAALTYKYVFDDDYTPSGIDGDNPLTIDFLGKTLTITSMTDTTGSGEIVAQVGDEYIMTEGQSQTIGTHSVTLDTVGESSVYVIVDGVAKSVAEGSTVKFGSGDNAIRIKLKDALYSDKKDSKAVLIIGEYASQTYEDGDAFTIPCTTPESSDCDEDHPDWVWDISITNSTDDYIGITNDFTWNNYKKPVLGVGDTIKMPHDFIAVKLDSLKTDKTSEFDMNFDDSYDLSDLGLSTGANVFDLVAIGQDGEGFTINSVDTDEIILYYGSGVINAFYVNDDGDLTNSTLTENNIVFTMNYGDSEIDAAIKAESSANTLSNHTLWIDFDGNTTINGAADLELAIQNDGSEFTGYGTTVGDAEAADAYLGTTAIGTREYDLLSKWGILMTNPDEGFGEDMVTFNIPDEQQVANVVISTLETTSTTNWAAIEDTDVASYSAKNVIAIGGTAVNKVARKILGLDENTPVYGTDEAWETATDGVGQGEGILDMVASPYTTGKYALLVAGYEGTDTEKTANFLTLRYSTLSGKSKVIVDTVNNVEATA